MEYLLKPLGKVPETAVSKTHMVMLTGGGADYVWGLNGKSSMHDTLFQVREGERHEVMFHNMTGMACTSTATTSRSLAWGWTASMVRSATRSWSRSAASVTIQFDADNPGTWPLHCHHMYHMNSGMMGTIAYASAA